MTYFVTVSVTTLSSSSLASLYHEAGHCLVSAQLFCGRFENEINVMVDISKRFMELEIY